MAHLAISARACAMGLPISEVMSAASSAVSLSSMRELAHAQRAMGERHLRVAGECGLGERHLVQQFLAGERREAAQQNSGSGIDGLDGHGFTQRPAYQERRANGEERSLRAIAPSMPGLKIKSVGKPE